MAESLDIRRKRLAFRAWHRGTKELDLLIGNFADRHLNELSADQLDRFEAMLEVPEPVMYRWATGQEAPPADYDHDVMKLLLEFKIPR
jgi:antitoxin CptB